MSARFLQRGRTRNWACPVWGNRPDWTRLLPCPRCRWRLSRGSRPRFGPADSSCRHRRRRKRIWAGVLLVDSLCEKPERGEKEQGAKKIADKLDSFFHFVLLVQNLQEECERSVRQLSENRERKIGILCGYTNELRIEWPLVQWIRICPGCRIAKKSSCGNGKDA